jgi:hypothetical protein
MTEAEWRACDEPRALVWFLRRTASDRKLRLLVCAFCRHIEPLLAPDPWHRIMDVAERYADGSVNDRERLHAMREVRAQYRHPQSTSADATHNQYLVRLMGRSLEKRVRPWCDGELGSVQYACWRATENLDDRTRMKRWPELTGPENRWHANVIRDVFGNPFCPASANPSWLTSTVVALARGIYEDRAFDRLPILADALQDAGCNNEDILDHCRGPGPHVRGCWVVDSVLAKL